MFGMAMAGAVLTAATAGGVPLLFLADHIASHRHNDHRENDRHKNGAAIVCEKL